MTSTSQALDLIIENGPRGDGLCENSTNGHKPLKTLRKHLHGRRVDMTPIEKGVMYRRRYEAGARAS